MAGNSARKASLPHLVSLVGAVLAMLTAPAALTQQPESGPQSNSALLLPAVSYDSGGYFPRSIAVGDVNGDGAPDLVVANTCATGTCAIGSVSVLLNTGDGSFQWNRTYDSGGAIAESVAVTDLNSDGNLDFAVANCGPIGINTCGHGYGVLGVSLGNGNGTFRPVVTFDSGGIAARSISAADVNGDRSLDLLVANGCGTSPTCVPGSVSVLLGGGNATFGSANIYDTTYDINWISAADVNGDGALDLLVTSGGNNRVGVLPGNGDGTFQSIAIYEPGGIHSNAVAAVDANRDGTTDLVVANTCNDSCTSGRVGVLLGTGAGGFRSAAGYDSGGTGAGSIVAADVDGDGKPDVVVANRFYDTAGVLLGNGDGTFQAATTYGSGGTHATSVAVADLNGDSAPDLAVANAFSANSANGAVGVLLNNADTTPPTIAVSATPHILWPPDGKLTRVTVVGRITDLRSGVNTDSAAYAVSDEYGQVQPNGTVFLGPDGTFSFAVLLRASRRGTDSHGRRYTVTLRAADNAGNRASSTAIVAVPHDRKR